MNRLEMNRLKMNTLEMNSIEQPEDIEDPRLRGLVFCLF
jgi:hypothetical protein